MAYPQVLAKLAKLFKRANVPFAVIGGQAVLVYGAPRLTQDVDISIAISPYEAEAIVSEIIGNGYQSLVDKPLDFLKETFVLPLLDQEYSIRIDLIFSLSEFEQSAISRAVTVEVDHEKIPFVTAEDLIIMKLIAARPRDIEDVRGILLRQQMLDFAYISFWGKQYDEELETQIVQKLSQLRDDIL